MGHSLVLDRQRSVHVGSVLMPDPVTVNFGEYLPDLPSLGNPGALKAENVVPAANSYRPLNSLVEYSSALAERCVGSAAYKSAVGALTVFAGTATKLYTLGSTTTSFIDATRASGTAYGTDERWVFNQFGDFVTAWNGVDDTQVYTLGSSTQFAALGGSPPKARYATNALEQVMVGHISDGPNDVAWNQVDSLTVWTAGTNLADRQTLQGYGAVMGLAGNRQIHIWCERGIFAADFAGPPTGWNILPMERERGTIFPGSVIGYGAVSFGLCQDGFYVFDGMSAKPIGQDKFSKTILADFNQSFADRMNSAIDPVSQCIAWAYPSGSSVSGNPDRILFFHWPTGRAALCAIDSEWLCNVAGFDITLDGLDAISSSLDALPFSLDSRAWQAGGNLQLAAFTTSHKLASFTGSSLAAVIDTGEAELFPGMKTLIVRARPIVEGTSVTATITAITRNKQTEAPTVGNAKSVGDKGFATIRKRARYQRGRITIAAGSTWTHATGIQVWPVRAGYQ